MLNIENIGVPASNLKRSKNNATKRVKSVRNKSKKQGGGRKTLHNRRRIMKH